MPEWVGRDVDARFRDQKPLDEQELWLGVYLDRVRSIQPGQVDAFKEFIRGNPNVSPGLITGMAAAGILPKPGDPTYNPVAAKLLDQDLADSTAEKSATTPRTAGTSTNPLLAPGQAPAAPAPEPTPAAPGSPMGPPSMTVPTGLIPPSTQADVQAANPMPNVADVNLSDPSGPQSRAGFNALGLATPIAAGDDDKAWFDRVILDKLVAPVTRAGFAALSAPLYAAVGAVRNVGGDIFDPNDPSADKNLMGRLSDASSDALAFVPGVGPLQRAVGIDTDSPDPWRQTEAGEWIWQYAHGGEVDAGSGFLPGGNLAEKSGEQARAAWTSDGSAWTLGRGLAGGLGMDPDSNAYKALSGIGDAAVSLLGDPTIIGGKVKASVSAAKVADRTVKGMAAGKAAELAAEGDAAAASAARRTAAARAEFEARGEEVAQTRTEAIEFAKEAKLAGARDTLAQARTRQAVLGENARAVRDQLEELPSEAPTPTGAKTALQYRIDDLQEEISNWEQAVETRKAGAAAGDGAWNAKDVEDAVGALQYARDNLDNFMRDEAPSWTGGAADEAPGAPAWEGGPELFHGSAAAFDAPAADMAFDAGANNLFGPGFYTTESRGIADSYKGKGAKGDQSSASTYRVQWKGDGPPKMLDGDDAAPDWMKDSAASLTDVDEPWNVSTVRELYSELRDRMQHEGMTKAEADEVATALAEQAQAQGFDGIRHLGGKGDAERHNVSIFFDPERVEVAPVGAKSAAAAAGPAPAQMPDLLADFGDDLSGIADDLHTAPDLPAYYSPFELTPGRFMPVATEGQEGVGAIKALPAMIDARDSLPAALVVPKGLSATTSNAELLAEAEALGLGPALTRAYRKAGVDGFTNVRAAVGEDGGFLYLAGVDMRSADLSTGLIDDAAQVRHSMDFPDRAAGLEQAKRLREELTDLDGQARQADDDLAYRQTTLSMVADAQKAQVAARDRVALALEDELGVRELGTWNDVDLPSAINYLTGGSRAGRRMLEKVAATGDPVAIRRMTGGNLDAATTLRLAEAGTTDDVAKVLAPLISLGLDDSIVGPLSARLSVSSTGRPRIKVPGSRVAAKMGDKLVAEGEARTSFTGHVARQMTRTAPNERAIELIDHEKFLDDIDNYFGHVLLDEDAIDDLLRQGMVTDSPEARRRIVWDGLKMLNDQASEGLPNQDAVRELFTKTRQKADLEDANFREYMAHRASLDKAPTYTLVNGEEVEIAGPILVQQLSAEKMRMPDPDELRKLARIQATLTELGPRPGGKTPVRWLEDGATVYTDKIWRNVQLVRPAYIPRNVGEMQVRVALGGHASVLNRPLGVLAMMVGAPEGGAVRRLVESFEPYSTDVHGAKFKVENTDDLMMDAVNEYAQLARSTRSLGDARIARQGADMGYTNVGIGNSKFFEGWASELHMLNADPVARAVAGGLPEHVLEDAARRGLSNDDAVYEWFVAGAGNKERQRLIAASQDRGLDRVLNDPAGVRSYLFDSPDSVKNWVHSKTLGGDEGLMDLVRYGTGQSGEVKLALSRKPNGWKKTEAMLREHYNDKAVAASEDPTFRMIARVTVEQGAASKVASGFAGIADTFFAGAAKVEHTSTTLPEWRAAYWDAVGHLPRAMDADALAALTAKADETLKPLKVGGVTVGNRHRFYAEAKKAKGDGEMTLDDVHAFASRAASRHVSELFYDAHKRSEFWEAARLASPFIQPTVNTIRSWGSLAYKNPLKVYSATKAFEGGTDTDSNVIYGITNTPHDPSQGFFYRNRQTGDYYFTIPVAGSILGELMNPLTPGKDPIDQGLPLPVSSFNFAMPGSILPGVGPALTIPAAMTSVTDPTSDMGKALGPLIYPFGPPDVRDGLGGIAEGQIPPWARKVAAGMGGIDQNQYAGQMKGAMSYLASTGEYGQIGSPDFDQQRLLKDAEDINRWTQVMRGVFQFAGPVGPGSEFYNTDPTGARVAQSVMYSAYNQMRDNHPEDPEAAVAEFGERFGWNNVLSIASGSSGGGQPTVEAWSFVRDNPDKYDEYGDVVNLMYPGSGFSQAFYKWQQVKGARRTLTPKEVAEQADSLVYNAAVAQIELTQANNNFDDDWLAEQKAALKEAFGGATPVQTFTKGAGEKRIVMLAKAIDDPAFASSKVRDPLRAYMTARDKELKSLRSITGEPNATLGRQDAVYQRQSLSGYAAALTKQYPDSGFNAVYTRIFADELKES